MVKNILISILLLLVLGCEGLFFGDGPDISDPLVTYDAFYDQVDQNFSFFEYLNADFDSAYNVNREELVKASSPAKLFSALNELVQVLQDGHTNVFLGRTIIRYNGWFSNYPANQLDDISHYFQSYTELNQALEYGVLLGSNLGYIKVNTFTRNMATRHYEQIDEILEEFSNLDGIVIDVRSNGGGSSNNSDLISSRFNDEVRFAFSARTKNGPGRDDFGDWIDVYTEVYSGERFLKPVAVLSNRRSYSATEWFISGMRTIPHVTIIGDTTGGGSGNPLFMELPNGWAMRVSNSQKQLPNGRDYQYLGIFPDIPVWIAEEDFNNEIDTILEKAIELLSE